QRRSGWVQPLTLRTEPTPSLRATPPEGIYFCIVFLVTAVTSKRGLNPSRLEQQLTEQEQLQQQSLEQQMAAQQRPKQQLFRNKHAPDKTSPCAQLVLLSDRTLNPRSLKFVKFYT
ncbi:MAG: hypothetical protein AAFP07_19210, partial [Cyanobacteria bacterium J06606_4]